MNPTMIFLPRNLNKIGKQTVSLVSLTLMASCTFAERKADTPEPKLSLQAKRDFSSISKSNDAAKAKLNSLKKGGLFLADEGETPTDMHIQLVVDSLEKGSQIATALLKEESQASPVLQTSVCLETKYVAEGMQVFAAILNREPASSDEKRVAPVLVEIASDLKNSIQNPTCQNAAYNTVTLVPQASVSQKESGLTLTESESFSTDGPSLSTGNSGDRSTAETNELEKASNPQFDAKPYLAFTEALTSLNQKLGNLEFLSSMDFVNLLKKMETLLNQKDLTESKVIEACLYFSLARTPLLGLVNYDTTSKETIALLTNALCK